MTRTESLEIYRKYLFDKPEKLPADVEKRLVRIRSAFTHWCEFPMKSEVEIIKFLTSNGISKSMAYNDLDLIKVLLGNVKNAGKEWHRYRLISMAEETYKLAKDKKDTRGMAMAMDKYGKYTQLHIPDHEQIPFDQIVKQPFEITSDPTPLGIKPDPDIDSKVKKMKEKYADEIDDSIQDIDYVEILTNDNEDEE